MIDRKARDELAEALRLLFTVRMTTSEFNERAKKEWFASPDAAVRVAACFGRGVYAREPLFPSWFRSRRAGSPRVYREAARWIWFLETDLEYRWPDRSDDPRLGCLWHLSVLYGLPVAIILLAFALGDWLHNNRFGFQISFTWALVVLVPSILLWLWLHLRLRREDALFRQAGDHNVWPFLKRQDYEQARRTRTRQR